MLNKLLTTSPEVANYIRKLECGILDIDLHEPTLGVALEKITNLRALTLWYHNTRPRFVDPSDTLSLDWKVDVSLRFALQHLLGLPTLERLILPGYLHNIPIQDLALCPSLKYLEINSSGIVCDSDNVPLSKSLQFDELHLGITAVGTAKAFLSAIGPDGGPAIKFNKIKKFSVRMSNVGAIEVYEEMFRRLEKLVDVTITVPYTSTFQGLHKWLALSCKSLRLLDVSCRIKGKDADPLGGLCAELEKMIDNNVIKTLVIQISIHMDVECSTGNEWGMLDKMLTAPGWPSLKEVSLSARISRYETDQGDFDATMRNLASTQFTRLTSNQNIKFNYSFNTYVF